MNRSTALRRTSLLALLAALLLPLAALAAGAAAPSGPRPDFPIPLDAYRGEEGLSKLQVIAQRAALEPLNVVATALFLLAIVHTFLAPRIAAYAHHLDHGKGGPKSFKAELVHFLGEIEAVFGLWVLPLLVLLAVSKGWATTEYFFGHLVAFTEPAFVVVIMAMAATRPVLQFARRAIGLAARLGGSSPLAWWCAILVIGPLLGSFITEPAAMVICALLLSRQVLAFEPSLKLRYATLGLLFVNVSVGGTLTHFAAPPVLMVAGRWGWNLDFMLLNFGWKAAIGVVLSTALYALFLRGEFRALAARAAAERGDEESDAPVPGWIVAAHLVFLAWTVFTAHTPALFVGGFLFFIAFTQATAPHQSRLELRPALLVGFFLAGLVVHGTLQQWWIAPLLTGLDPLPLMLGAVVLTAFNDNAAITYLASLVPGFTPAMQYAVVAGAVTGGGLTVIANAPNPAGQAVLGKHFAPGISPLYLLLGAIAPTVIVGCCYWFF